MDRGSHSDFQGPSGSSCCNEDIKLRGRSVRIKWDHVITAMLLSCAAITTALVIRHELGARSPSLGAPEKTVFIQRCKSHLDRGVRLGPRSAPAQLIEFADFECPFCGDFHKKLKDLRRRYPTEIALTYVHFPLPMHRFAVPAARVSDCAGDQGRFEAMYDQLFDGQDQFGLKSWDDYAIAAGVPDIQEFDACIKKTEPIPRVEEGKALGAKLDVKATPTIIINGWMLGRPPTAEELDEIVQRVLAGKSPVDGTS